MTGGMGFWACGAQQQAEPGDVRFDVRFVPCVDGSALARTFFTSAALVVAAMCSAFECGSHDRWP
jgi:hypothetical protein